MFKKLFAAAVFAVQVTLAYKPMNEEVRFTEGDVGLAVSLSQDGLNYLKTAGLPYLYSKISDIKVGNFSMTKGWLDLDLVNIDVKLPQPDVALENNWVATYDTKTNSVGLKID